MKLSNQDLKKITDNMFKTFKDVFDNLKAEVTNELKQEIHFEFLKYRQSISVREKWCCYNMQHFAAEMWHINQPAKNKDNFGVSYKFKGIDIIYCPFCGVKL